MEEDGKIDWVSIKQVIDKQEYTIIFKAEM